MKTWFVMARTYNCYGGHSTLSLLDHFFLKDMPDFGPALQELSTTFHFPHPGPPKTSLEELFEEFHSKRSKLPKVFYRPARQSASVDFSSELLSGADLHTCGIHKLEWFKGGAFELVQALELLRPRFKPAHNFDFPAFLNHCRSRLEKLPKTETEFLELIKTLELQDKKQRESLTAWDDLGIDFRDFHPEARALLDEPFYWDTANDFAPNGNDTGADILADYRTWLKRNDPSQAPDFLEQLLTRWKLRDDEEIRLQATIGLAFAEIKLRARCNSAIRSIALESIVKTSALVKQLPDSTLRDDCLKSLLKMESKLRTISIG